MHVAIIGCGQLARMMALAGWPMAVKFSFVADPAENTTCVEGLGDIVHYSTDISAQELYEQLGRPDVITVEREHVDCELLDRLLVFCPVHPNPDAIRVAQHRGREKSFLKDSGVSTVDFLVTNSKDALVAGIAQMGLPLLVKTCEEGYDGRGQWMLKTIGDVDRMLNEAPVESDLIIEQLANFDREVSIVITRSSTGETAAYPMAENTHQNGILLTSIAPAVEAGSLLANLASTIATKLIEKLDYVGVLSIEFFVMGNELLVNELAPRVHNSGHWTQAANVASQFENHIRAIIGADVGIVEPTNHIAMVNLLGTKVQQKDLHEPNVQLHDYNKASRPGRKLGHINLWSDDRSALEQQMNRLVEQIYAH